MLGCKAFFSFITQKEIQQVELWSYEKAKKLATVLLKKERETCLFTYAFKNYDLRLTLYSFNLKR